MTIPSYGYICVLLFSLSGLMWLDYRRKLALFIRPKTTLLILIIALGFFIAWDIAGICLGIFQTNSDFVSGIYLYSANMPIEEPLLLLLISYLTLLLNAIFDRRSK